jgi:glutathione peroxidase
MADTIYDIEVQTIDGEAKTLADHRGKVMLVVNTASKCGFTPQYEGLEQLYRNHAAEGLVVLGFPCDQFGHQEPGDNKEIQSFCSTRFDVTFPMHAKIEVNGSGRHPLYAHLEEAAPGLLGTQRIKWNFTKFLVDREGKVLERFGPTTTPEKLSGKLRAALKTD